MSKSFFDLQYDLLVREMDHLQSAIREYDKVLFTIRGWAITLFSTSIFFAFRDNMIQLLFLSVFLIILFWFMDAAFKSYQTRFIQRYRRIEFMLQNDLSVIAETNLLPMVIPQMIDPQTLGHGQLLKYAWIAARRDQVRFTYVFMFITLGIAFVIYILSFSYVLQVSYYVLVRMAA